jgi:xanthine dehydrogenase accessory factor
MSLFDTHDKRANVVELAASLVQRKTPAALCTVVRTRGSVPRHPGAKMLVDASGTLLAGTVGGGAMESQVIELARQCIADGKPRLSTYRLADPASGDPGVCGGEVEIFIEPLLSTPTLLVIGAGHVGQALIYLAKWAGFRVLLADDRAELCTAEAAPGADEYLPGPLSETLQRITLTPLTYVALVTRSYPIDVDSLPTLLDSPAAYIGVIGSQRRWLTTAKALRERGVSDEALTRIAAPIGLEIGAETPAEIAISIMAQVIAHWRQASSSPA